MEVGMGAHVVYMEDMRNAYKILVETSDRKSPLKRSMCGGKVKTNIKMIVYECGVDSDGS
jgi:hypothetical protein